MRNRYHHKQILFFFVLMLMASLHTNAQIGQHRNDLSIGFSGGYSLSSVGFNPSVPQSKKPGFTAGFTMRYVCEKYFSSICAIQMELNYVQLGWKEKIWDVNDQPVINATTGLAEKYERTMNYLQLPVLARLGWGREERGFQFFFQAGPQIGYFISENTKQNFDLTKRNMSDRVSSIVSQDTMAVENKFDYGITAGVGLEYSNPHIGHILLEGRYYYGLGDMYGNSKRDYFGRSNFSNIIIKITYLFDIMKTKK